MVVSSAFFARSAQSAQNAAAERGVANATGVRCFKLPQATPKSVFAMPRAGKVREVICASAPHQGQEQRDTPSGVGMISGAGLFLIAVSFLLPMATLFAVDTILRSVHAETVLACITFEIHAVAFHLLKIEHYRLFVLHNVSVDEADLVNVVFSEFLWNLLYVSSESL